MNAWASLPSLVMKEMNSLTHSCMHSLASLAILALSGRAIFMMRATGAKLRMLASDDAVRAREGERGYLEEGDGGEPSDDMMRCEWLEYRGQGCDANHGEPARAQRMRGLVFRAASIVAHLSGLHRA